MGNYNDNKSSRQMSIFIQLNDIIFGLKLIFNMQNSQRRMFQMQKIESKMTQRLCKTKSAVENLDILCNQSNIRLLASIKCKCLYAITRKNMSEINVNAFKLVTKMHYYASCACNHLHHIQSKTFQFPRKIRPTTKAKHTTISPVEEFSILYLNFFQKH